MFGKYGGLILMLAVCCALVCGTFVADAAHDQSQVSYQSSTQADLGAFAPIMEGGVESLGTRPTTYLGVVSTSCNKCQCEHCSLLRHELTDASNLSNDKTANTANGSLERYDKLTEL